VYVYDSEKWSDNRLIEVKEQRNRKQKNHTTQHKHFTQHNTNTNNLAYFKPVHLFATMKFRPCIDLHSGQVKQIVGSTLKDTPAEKDDLATNFETDRPAGKFTC